MLEIKENPGANDIAAVRSEMLANITDSDLTAEDMKSRFNFQLQELEQLAANCKAPNAIKIFSGIFFNRCQKELERLLLMAQVIDAERKALRIVKAYKRKANFVEEQNLSPFLVSLS